MQIVAAWREFTDPVRLFLIEVDIFFSVEVDLSARSILPYATDTHSFPSFVQCGMHEAVRRHGVIMLALLLAGCRRSVLLATIRSAVFEKG